MRLKVKIKNALEEANTDANKALMMHNFDDQNHTKGVEDSNFFEDPNGQIGPISGGGEIDSN